MFAAILCLQSLTSCLRQQKSTFDPRGSKNPAANTRPRAIDPAFAKAQASQPPPELLSPPTTDYVLGPKDKIEIELFDEPGSRTETFVTPDGRVYFDLLGGVLAEGKSTSELKTSLENELYRYYQNPQVGVTLVEAESQQFTVLGRVNAPGNYPIREPLKILDAIAVAGGLFTSRFTGTTEELADLQHSFIVRDGQMLPVDFQALIRNGDLSQNIYLKPNDLLYLPSALTNEVYVLGAVTEPRPVGLMNEMTLTAALGRGLGILRTAHLDQVAIIRGSLTSPRIAIVDAAAILRGEATNIRLEPGDIVYLPGEKVISADQIGRNAVDTFVQVVAANEGANAGVGADNASRVGVTVPLGVQ